MFTKHPKLYSFFLWIICCLTFLYPSYDPDLGWHLRYGEYFLEHGRMLTENTFSWTLPDFHFYYLTIVYDIILAAIFAIFSFPGISIFAALLIGSALFFTLKQTPHPLLHAIGLAIFSQLPLPLLNVGPRSQIFSLFFFSLLWWILHNQWHHKHRWLLPVIFLIWANTHGQVLIGIGIYGLYLIAKFWETKKIDRQQTILLIISGLLTFLTPFGYHLHLDIISYLNSPILRGVTEWQPWVWWTPHGLALICYAVCISLALYKLKPSLKITLPIIAIALLAFRARRMVPWFLIISLPVLLEWLKLKLQKKNLKPTKYYLGYGLTLLILILNLFRIFQQPVFSQTWDDYCQGEVQCSEGMINFLQQNNLNGKIFNAYNLGGHLIYRYPQLPVFIDGRMILWQFPEGEYIFAHYAPIIHAQSFAQQLFEDYNFDYVIINHGYPLKSALQEVYQWPAIYQDDKVIVFKNPQ